MSIDVLIYMLWCLVAVVFIRWIAPAILYILVTITAAIGAIIYALGNASGGSKQ